MKHRNIFSFAAQRLTLGMSLVMTASVGAWAEDTPVVFSGEFSRVEFETVMGSEQSVAVDCQDATANYPYNPYDWPDAKATLEIWQAGGRSHVTVVVTNARPDTLYTTWLSLKGKDASGVAYGGSPLTGKGATPLIPTSHLNAALDAMKNPTTDAINGFQSDSDGNGGFAIDLDYPIFGGAYPFERFEGFDATDARYPVAHPSNTTTAIMGANSGALFTLRVVSHCTDGLSRGLVPGLNEGWFDWKME